MLAGGNVRPLKVAGVAGGVGTSTCARALWLRFNLPVQDCGVYRGGDIDVLVTSNTATATAQLGLALQHCPRPPVLIVMNTVPGLITTTRAYLRAAEPHIVRQLTIPHQRVWLELDKPPGRHFPKAVSEVIAKLPAALHEMYAAPPRPKAPPASGLVADHGRGALGLEAPLRPAVAPYAQSPPYGGPLQRNSQGG